jgi:glycosyltransferase involved in cell wall biosynthesis
VVADASDNPYRLAPVLRVGPLHFHMAWRLTTMSDLVVLPQELKYGLSYFLLARRVAGLGGRLAMWGHGRNFQVSNPDSAAERFKRRISKLVDWWFAYTSLSAEIVKGFGFPAGRVTEVGNAIDTRALERRRSEISDCELALARTRLGLTGRNVAIYSGSLTKAKDLGFLIGAARRIRELVADFDLLVIGGGPEEECLRTAAAASPWIHPVGPVFDLGRVCYWALADVCLMPRAIGLVALESLVLGVPIVTTNSIGHGPEIAYLKDGVNAVTSLPAHNIDAYALCVAALFGSRDRLGELQRGARASGVEHSIERMIGNFADGILNALRAPRRSRADCGFAG